MSSMSASLHNTTDKGSIAYDHNNRTYLSGNKDIDPERVKDNIYYVQGAKNLHEWVNQEFAEAVEKYNTKQKRSDRKIDDMYEKLLKDKKVTLEREFITQVGEKADFWNEDGSRNEENWNKAKNIMDQYAKSFQERNPNFRVYNMALHLDEGSPHLHVNYLPVYHATKGLEKRVSWEKAAKEQGIEPTRGTKKKINKETGEIEEYQGVVVSQFQKWRDQETDYIEQLLQEHKIERHIVGSHAHMSVQEYKDLHVELQETEQKMNDMALISHRLDSKASEKRKEISSLSEEYEDIEYEYQQLEGKLEKTNKEIEKAEETLQVAKELIADVEHSKFGSGVEKIPVKEKKDMLGRSTGMVVVEVPKSRWEEVKKAAMTTEAFRRENHSLQDKNESLEGQNKFLRKDKESLKRENEGLQKGNKGLVKENSNLKKENARFRNIIERVKTLCKERFPDIGRMFGYAKAEALHKEGKELLKKDFAADEISGAGRFVKEKEGEQRELYKQNRERQRHQGYELDR